VQKTHSEIAKILGSHTEPWKSVELVQKYRDHFRPAPVRVILLAESHVFTRDDERDIVIPPLPCLKGYPTEYARFVYCLGYGERSLTNDQNHPRRDGTPQYWKVFFSCNNPVSLKQDFYPILSKTSYQQRLQNKINLLHDLKAKGIWLVDASIVALYKDSKKLPHWRSALKKSWELYTRQVVLSANPNHVICIGKDVASVVGTDLEIYFKNRHNIIPQPNAFLTSKEHMNNYQLYWQLCQ
jgi:hypothetical protein